MMRHLLIFLVVFLPMLTLAQQDPQFTQNMYNRLFPNPAFAGANGNICVTSLGRQQWTGFSGSPATFLLSGHAPVPLLYGNIGLTIHQDEIAQIRTTGVKLAYAYRTQLSRFSSLPGELSAGIGLGFVNATFGTDWSPIDDDDPIIPFNGDSDGGFDMDFGLYYNIDDKLYFGVSMMHLTQSELTGAALNYEVQRNYYIMAGYKHILSPTLELEPSTFIKTDGQSAQFDVNCNVVYNDFLWGGISYRVTDAISPMFGIKYDIGPGRLIAGYSYDLTTSQIRRYSTGSHELMLNYCFSIPKKVKLQRHGSVRFL